MRDLPLEPQPAHRGEPAVLCTRLGLSPASPFLSDERLSLCVWSAAIPPSARSSAILSLPWGGGRFVEVMPCSSFWKHLWMLRISMGEIQQR